MENMYGLAKQRSGLWESIGDGDFQEEEVWDLLDEHQDYHTPKPKQVAAEPTDPFQRFRPSAAKMIPRITTGVSNKYSISPKQDRGVPTMRQNSAPVNIPDWSEIQAKRSKKSGHDYDDDVAIEDYDDDNLPPDEFFLARSQSSTSFSVTVGNGRTLRGRDLRKVRNAVLKQTGFLE